MSDEQKKTKAEQLEELFKEIISSLKEVVDKLDRYDRSHKHRKRVIESYNIKERYHSGIQTISSVTTDTYPVEINILESLAQEDNGRPGHIPKVLYLVNLGPGNIFTKVSSDGVEYNNNEIKCKPSIVTELYNVYKVKLRTDYANTSYVLTEFKQSIGFSTSPSTLIVGSKTDISTTASKLVSSYTPIKKVVTVKVRSLGSGTYIAIGDSSSQPFRLNFVGDSLDIDFIDDLSKVYVITDSGSTGELEWIGG